MSVPTSDTVDGSVIAVLVLATDVVLVTFSGNSLRG